jgi:predicted aldo/keto reductase-like oxidoreductase
MQYKPFGKTGISLSTLGFGAMRLPMTETNSVKHVDYEKAVPMLHRAFELGVNYVDTAPGYCEKDSEVAVGKALKGWRDKVYLSTKNPIEDASGDHWRERLENSLKKLDTDYIDFYHMWGINLESYRTEIDVKNGPMEAAQKALSEGLIKHLSFSFHDKAENMIPIIDSGNFTSVLCQYNLLDRTNEKSIAYASEKGLGVVIMGPVGGGRLGAPSESIRKLLKQDIHSTAEMALRFVLANESVNIALSGMQTVEMVEENAKVASIEGPMTKEELIQVQQMLDENKRLSELYCTGCKYCMPCPQKVNIPQIFSRYNDGIMFNTFEPARRSYSFLTRFGQDASLCVACKACEKKCPQHIPIVQELKAAHEKLKGWIE